MYELAASLSGQRTPEAVAHVLARQIQQMFQASQVNVIYRPGPASPGIAVSHPVGGAETGHPDRVIPLLNSWGLVGEVQIWRGTYLDLPHEEDALLGNFALQAARAFERTQPEQAQQSAMVL